MVRRVLEAGGRIESVAISTKKIDEKDGQVLGIGSKNTNKIGYP